MTKKLFNFGHENVTPGSRQLQTLAELEVEGTGKFQIDRIATVGRAQDCQVILNIRSVSRHHARIFFEGGHFWIKDLDSGNGTTVNGKSVKLQMLTDNDRILFGEAKAIFRNSEQSFGPARLAQDPLEGADPFPQDGTPTGGLKGHYRTAATTAKLPERGDTTLSEAAPGGPQLENAAVSRNEIEQLRRENVSLRRELLELRAASNAPLSIPTGELEKENARLKRLVSQLERALADSNLRIRNLQDRLK